MKLAVTKSTGLLLVIATPLPSVTAEHRSWGGLLNVWLNTVLMTACHLILCFKLFLEPTLSYQILLVCRMTCAKLSPRWILAGHINASREQTWSNFPDLIFRSNIWWKSDKMNQGRSAKKQMRKKKVQTFYRGVHQQGERDGKKERGIEKREDVGESPSLYLSISIVLSLSLSLSISISLPLSLHIKRSQPWMMQRRVCHDWKRNTIWDSM